MQGSWIQTTYQVVAEQLHDQGAVLVALLAQCVELCSRTSATAPCLRRKQSLTGNGIIECLLRKMASLVGSIEDLVVEDREVEGKTQTDGVGGRQLGLGNLGGSLVGLERLVGRILATVADGELSEVTVVVALPIMGLATQKHDHSDRADTDILW